MRNQLTTTGTNPGSLHPLSKPKQLKRAVTSSNQEGESSKRSKQTTAIPEPRLITPQIAQEFFILKLDLKLGALSQTELIHSLEKSSIASLLDGKISQSVRHLLALIERIEDTSSKVLITGDLNAGKSTFCNALLRRKVLPEDQQPCTNIFCEVLDVRENGGLEEVHAVHREATYNRNNESTYDTYTLHNLEQIVGDSMRYTQAKVYLKDIRTPGQSLLNNDTVDISIIDAPGLNKDSLRTTAVFSRQEEIDIVVFVLSAENHFTLSAKEFIQNAAHEKAYIFMVVNRFDNIRDQDRCQRAILDQVQALSPHTFEESAELVHFVSSNAVPITLPNATSSSGGDRYPSNDDDDPKDEGKGKATERAKLQDFQTLEESLRRFVLEKRARSKLAPAKTYVLNVLSDINALATVNRDVSQSEFDRVTRELADLEPICEESKKVRAQVVYDIDLTIEETVRSTYAFTRSELNLTVSHIAEEDLRVPYPGIFGLSDYATSIKAAMLSRVSEAVTRSEQYARGRTVQAVNSIASLGLLHLGNEYTTLTFREDIMFKRRRDMLARQVDANLGFWDFFATDLLVQNQEKIAGASIAMSVLTLLGGRMIGGLGWVDGVLGTIKIIGSRNTRALILPSLLVTTVGAAAYVLHQVPNFLPRCMSAKISASIVQLDFVHTNCERISAEVRKVLQFPTDNLRMGLQLSIDKFATKREAMRKAKGESEVAWKYFANLVVESRDSITSVGDVNLEHDFR